VQDLGIIVIDSLTFALPETAERPGGVNFANNITPAFKELKKIAQATQAAVIVITHTRPPFQKNGKAQKASALMALGGSMCFASV